MRRHNQSRRGGDGASARGAFSLVELMIAMIILFFGLLVIGAALPVGLHYSRKTTEASKGEDAAQYAMAVLAARIRISQNILRDNLFRSRADSTSIPPFALDPSVHPRIKVRPFAASNIDATPDVGTLVSAYTNTAQESEWIIARWFLGTPHVPLFEYNVGTPDPPIPSAIPSVLRVYPPISANVPITVASYANDRYARRRITEGPNANNDQESVKALDRQVVWTAFHRRVSYAPGSDPSLYEVIVVVAKRPTAQHRFARQDSSPAESFVDPIPFVSYPNLRGNPGNDRLAPTAWLVHFTGVPFPDLLGIYTHSGLTNPERMLDTGAVEPPSLQFTCSIKVGEKLPPGSIIIPALNDANNSDPTQPGGAGLSGFVPHAPDSLPIYEVTDRIRDDSAPAGQEYKIIVKNNGTYPWVDPSQTPRVSFWPAWIIPPAIKTDSGTNQVFENKSPIIAVARRYMRFPEVP